ncbi:hypothetical protein SAY86_008408 [Trapa natans]|uniref:Uncharacterized protein n=1 Tax=Trapa natans TaxID=22666 RepID=A0AAN7KH50_TRANT|nr:hypothetical protein SAY86_008408 [Trapa natans]
MQDAHEPLFRKSMHLELPVPGNSCTDTVFKNWTNLWLWLLIVCQAMEKSITVAESPARSAKFIPIKHWIVVGSDDGYIRVFDYRTSEKVHEFKAHEDYIRCVEVHPTLSCIFTASDDGSIKLWDWEKDWTCCRTFEGHSHYVMHLALNPKDDHSFASASLDGTLKIWSVDSPVPRLTIGENSEGLNCVEFFFSHADGKLYLLSGSDDHTAKVWDYVSGECLHTLKGHEHNVTAVFVHPQLPIVITGSEDTKVRVWSKATKCLETTMDLELGRIWYIGYIKDKEQVAFACDEGIVTAKILSSGVESE